MWQCYLLYLYASFVFLLFFRVSIFSRTPNILLFSTSIAQRNVYYWILSSCLVCQCIVIICNSVQQFLLLCTFLFLYSWNICLSRFPICFIYSFSSQLYKSSGFSLLVHALNRHLDCTILLFVSFPLDKMSERFLSVFTLLPFCKQVCAILVLMTYH